MITKLYNTPQLKILETEFAGEHKSGKSNLFQKKKGTYLLCAIYRFPLAEFINDDHQELSFPEFHHFQK